MKVLLSHAYFLVEDEVESKIMMPYPPQGILHIGAFLKSKGIECEIYDSTFKDFDELTHFLESEKPQYLGLYANLMTRPNIIKIIRFIRESDSLKEMTVILGGPDVRHHTKLYIQNGADYCVSGEGEKVFFQLITNLENKDFENIQNLKGISFQKKSLETITNEDFELIADLDKLPFPDFRMINLTDYFTAWKQFHGYSSMTISTMRGCPFSCRWCSKAVYGRSFRRRSASLVVEEISRLQEKYTPERFWFVDDVFTINKQWLVDFRDAVLNAKLEFKYECITRADKLDWEMIKLLKESGCFRLWIGGESGSQKVLDLMDRGVKAELIREMIKLTKKAGIEAGTFLMLGYPGETEEDIIETSRHLKEAAPDQFTLTLSYPIPGTEFYNLVKDKGLKAPGEWGTYSDRSLDFDRTYKTAYYPHAIRYIQHSVKADQLKHENRKIESVKSSMIALASRGLMFLNK